MSDNNGIRDWLELVERESDRISPAVLMGALSGPNPPVGAAQEAVIRLIRKRAIRIARAFVSKDWGNDGWDVVDAAMHAVNLAIARPESKDAEFARVAFVTFVRVRCATAMRQQNAARKKEEQEVEADEAEEGPDTRPESVWDTPASRELEQLRTRFQEFLAGIEDPRERRAVQMRQQGYLWEEVAAGMDETVETVRAWVRKYVPPMRTDTKVRHDR